MMNEETTFNARSAVLYGFADGILYAGGEADEGEPVTFSRAAVTNSLLAKIPPQAKPKRKQAANPAKPEVPPGGVAYNVLEARFNNLKF